jgi:flagellar biosynthesis protein FlhG
MDQARHLRDMVEGRKEIQRIPLIQNRDMQAPAKGNERVRVISVTSGKGGVGKTNVVANLAVAMGKMGRRVLILDADLGLANMDILLGLNPRFTIQHVISGERRLQEVILSTPGGCHLLPAASGIQELTDLDYSQRLFLLNELDCLQDQFDILLIDTGAGISANVMYFNFAAMERVVVVTNEPTSLTDAYALIKVLTKKYRQRKFKILVNVARNPEEGLRIFKQLSAVVDRFLGSPAMDYLGCVQHDENVPRAVRQQQAVVQRYPDTRASKDFIELAERILSEDETSDFEGDIKFFWQRLLSC